MQLKIKSRKKLSSHDFKSFIKSRRKIKLLALLLCGALVIITVALSSTYYGMVLYKTGEGDGFMEFLKNGIDAKFGIVPNFFRGLMTNPERIFIDIKQGDFEKLAYKRALALETGNLFATSTDFVPAEIRYNNETFKVKIRLKGDHRDHWRSKVKWSFRIEMKGDNTLFGMESFSIQHPRVRDYFNEWVFYKLLGYNDMFAMRYDFIDVTFNGKHLGIYALEGHFESRTIESNQKRAGVIIRFDRYPPGYQNYPLLDSEIYALTYIDSFETGSIEKDEQLSKQFNQAKNLLESFKRGKLSASQVFDIDKLAMLFAIEDLTGFYHSTAFRNIRFYYNPITSLLEPIGYDNQVIQPMFTIQGANKQIQLSFIDNETEFSFGGTIFKDREFFEKYIQALETISSKEYLDQFFEVIGEEYKDKLSILYKSFPGYKPQVKEIFYKNQEYLKNILNPNLALQAYFNDFNSYNSILSVGLGNMQVLPIQVISLVYNNNDTIKPNNETILQPRKELTPIDFNKVDFSMPPELGFEEDLLDNLAVKFKILGLDTERTVPIFKWTYLDQDFLETDLMRTPPNWQQFGFLETDWSSEIIYIKPGVWQVNENIIFPADFTVWAEGNIVLDMRNSAKIVSRSPVKFLGRENAPVIIKSSDFTGQGIIVLEAKEKSVLQYVFFDGLSALKQGDWELTGSVNFYESPVNIAYCKFSNNKQGDDYLNIVRSDFSIENTLFLDTFADAIDLDFSKGAINNVSFINIGDDDGNGDAIDFSGSVVDLKAIIIDGVGDKGLSVGENSQVTAEQVEIKGTSIGVAVKDLSELELRDVSIRESIKGIVVFQKKPEFGPAKAVIDNFIQEDIVVPYIVEYGSSLTVNGKAIKETAENVAETLYGK